MDVRKKVYAAADRLALTSGEIDLPVAKVRPLAKAKLGAVAESLKAWKKERRALGAGLPAGAVRAVVELAERIFILGKIAAMTEIGDVGDGAPLRGRSEPPGDRGDDESERDEGSRAKPPANPPRRTGERSTPARNRRRLAPRVWQYAEDPKIAEVAARKLSKRGHPLGHKALNASLPEKMRFERPERKLPKVLAGSGLALEKGRWWFAGEERPIKPKWKEKPSRSGLAIARRRSPAVLAAVLAHLQRTGRTMRIVELTAYMKQNVELPQIGNFDYNWLNGAMRRLSKKETHLVLTSSGYRWMKRLSSARRRAFRNATPSV